MREILFRGKQKDWDNEWLYGYYTLCSNGRGMKPVIVTGTEENCFIPLEVFPETVGQYTGLTDKNGTKVFEGDIVEYHYEMKNGVIVPFRAEVKGGQKSFGSYNEVYGFCAYLEYGAIEHSKVIGNIHDNAELLKGGTE